MNRPVQDFHLLLRILHWLMALMILLMLIIGVGMVSTTGPLYPSLLALHRPIGVVILVLAGARLVLRLRTGAPPLPEDLPAAQKLAARGSHLLLYLAMVGLPLIGWGMLSAGGYPVEMTKGFALPAILPHDLTLFALLRQAHTLIALLFFALILAHLAAALVHGLIRRDGVLESMTIGHADTTQSVRQPEPEAPSPAEDGNMPSSTDES